jgi:succinate dehydrogenase / fumarate reductase cytochrome b subunit
MHNRPIYLNLFRLHLPLAGWVSILHRITGVILFLALPLALYLLERSLSHQAGFDAVAAVLGHSAGRMMLLAVLASLAFHALAGIRHLGLDIHWGVEKAAARRSAGWVITATLVVVALVAWRLFL